VSVAGGEIAYFATAATVIPVLFFAYSVALKDVFKELLRRQRQNEVTVDATGRIVHPVRAFLASLGLSLIRAVVACVFLLPLVAEILCFASLNADKTEPGAKPLVAIGLGVAAIPIFAPLFYAFALEPLFVQFWNAVELTGVPKRIRERKKSGDEQLEPAVALTSEAPREHRGEDGQQP
jgi:predicted cation transporter